MQNQFAQDCCGEEAAEPEMSFLQSANHGRSLTFADREMIRNVEIYNVDLMLGFPVSPRKSESLYGR